MKQKSKFLSAGLLILALALSGCGDTPTVKELSESDAVFTVDVCTVSGTLEEGILSMQVDYEVTNGGQEEVSQLTLLTPHLDGSAMNDLQLQLGKEIHVLQLQEKDVIPLSDPLQPGEQLSLCFTYHLDELALPDGSTEAWRITLPTLDKSAISTGVGKVEVSFHFDRAIQLKSSVPKGLTQAGETEISGELAATVNVLVMDVQ